MSEVFPRRRVHYLVRTDSLDSEARVSRLFGALVRRGYECTVFALVKAKSEFDWPNVQYVAWSERLRPRAIRLLFKLIEIQLGALVMVLRNCRRADVIVLANYDLLLLGILLRGMGRRVILDLHEHYFERLFHWRSFSRFFFLRFFTGAIFANRERAADFLGRNENLSPRVAVARNAPDREPGRVRLRDFTNGQRLKIGIVGGALPGRFVQESIRVLDLDRLKDTVEIITFGPETGEHTKFIQLTERGRFQHWKVSETVEQIDVSLVFYDPRQDGNQRLCEPNRFYQAYNAGKFVISFEHESLSQFFDEACYVVNHDTFSADLLQSIESILQLKSQLMHDPASPQRWRQVVTFEEQLENIGLLTAAQNGCGPSRSSRRFSV